jgi:5-methylcytosine-specific restriction endonuclease McrA
MSTVSEKRCSGCKEVRPVAEFWKRSKGGDGFQNYCKDCCRRKGAEWKAKAGPEKLSEYGRRTYQKHRRSRIDRVQAYYWKDPAKHKRRSLEWARKHPEKARASRSSWAKRNPDLIRQYVRQRRAWRQGVPSLPITAADLEAKFAFWGHCCWLCDGEPDAIDHVKPVSRGGAHMLCNLRPVCTPCNTRKKDRWPLD